MAEYITDQPNILPTQPIGGNNFTSTRPVEFDALAGDISRRLSWPNQAIPVNFYGVNLLEWVAELFKNKIFGKGIQVTSADEKVQAALDTLFADINFFNFFCETETICSTWGAAIIVIEFVEGRIRWVLANPWNLNIKNFQDTVYQSELTIQISDGVLQKYTFTPTTVKVEYTINPGKTSKEDLRELLALKDYEIKHNFNQKPLYYMLNKPAYSLYGNSMSQRKPDMMNCLGYQATMNKLMQTAYYELEMGKTRTYGMLSRAQWQDVVNSPRDIYKAFTSGVNAILSNQDVAFAPGNRPKWLEVIQATPVFGNYLDQIDHIIQMTKRAVGLSEDDQTQGIQRTALEVDTVQAEGNETIAIRKNWRITQIKELVVRSLIVANGQLDRNYLMKIINVELRENLGTDRSRRLEEAVQMYANNIMSYRGMLRYIDDLNEQESTEKFKQIIQERGEEYQLLSKIEALNPLAPAGEEGEETPEKESENA